MRQICLILCLLSIWQDSQSQLPANLLSIGKSGFALRDGNGLLYKKRHGRDLGINAFSYQRRLRQRWFFQVNVDDYFSLTLGGTKPTPKLFHVSISHARFLTGYYLLERKRLTVGAATGLSYHNDTKTLIVAEGSCMECNGYFVFGHRKGIASVPLSGQVHLKLFRQLYLSCSATYHFGMAPYVLSGNVPYSTTYEKFFRKNAFVANVSLGIGFSKETIRRRKQADKE